LGLRRSGVFFLGCFNSAALTPLKDKIAKNPGTHGAMLVPIIFGSDKTTVSVATRNNEYWLLYMSIGSVHNNIC
jgi:hypothetical protein